MGPEFGQRVRAQGLGELSRVSDIGQWILLCVAAFVWLAILLRRDRFSLGLPMAYMSCLLLIHVPGAVVPLLSERFSFTAEATGIGIRFTAIGAVCFVAGVQIVRFLNRQRPPVYRYVERREFWFFCLAGGLLLQFFLSFLGSVSGLQAAVDRGSMLWLLGALSGLRFGLASGDRRAMLTWGAASLVYPVLMLIWGGFLGFGSVAIIMILSALVVSVRNPAKLVVTGVVGGFVGLTIFVNYFVHRTEFREITWSSASNYQRAVAAVEMFADFKWFDPSDDTHLNAIDQRLNQNYFVGLAEIRLEQEQVGYLYGKSIWAGFAALVPRVLWPDKPETGGSGRMVADMTGLALSEDTSWGVGNVMEFQINFGTPGVMVGFLILGFLIGWLDYKAAMADAYGDLPKLILYFISAVALIQPGGSITEITGGAAAAVVMSFIWKWVWQMWFDHSHPQTPNQELAAYR